MITTRWVPRTRRFLVVAFTLSVLIHLFGGALWAHAANVVARVMHRLPEQHEREREIATADVVRLERRTVPRPARRNRPRPAPAPRPRVAERGAVARPPAARRPVPRPVQPTAPPPEIAYHRARAPLRAATPVPTSPPERVERPERAHHSQAAATASLSTSQIARLNARFAHTIAATHVDLATIQKQSEEQPVATVRRPLQFTGEQITLDRGEGYIEPITAGERIGGIVWYYTHYTYMWPDGHLEDDDIPWPFGFPAGRDLFAMHVHRIPLQLPPPGFRITRPLKPFLARFLREAGHG